LTILLAYVSRTATPSITALLTPLGDVYAGAPVRLVVPAIVTSVTIDGTPCTDVTQDGCLVSCLAPSKPAGTYDVQCNGPGGASNVLAGAWEAWHPTTTYAAARAYQPDQGVTSASSATRQRSGVQSRAYPSAYSPQTDTILPCDGQGLIELQSGRLIAAGGAPGGHAGNPSLVINTVWASDDRGKTWAVLLANAAGSSTRPAPGHTFGFFPLTIAGTEWVYWLGGDPFTPTGDVFRILGSDLEAGGDPTAWTRISTTCPTSGLVLYMYGTIGTDIYVIGGQTSIQDSGVPSKPTHRSTDHGFTWTTLGTGSNCPATVYGAQLGRLPEKDGKLWVCGSARYHSTINDFSSAVHSFDGTSWAEVLVDGHGQFLPTRYHSAVVDPAGKLWRFNGTTWDGEALQAESKSAYWSSDGATWTAVAFTIPWAANHAPASVATSDGIYLTEGYYSGHDLSGEIAWFFVVRESAGALSSAWTDLGSGAKTLSQATGSKQPILDAAAFGSQAGLVLTGAQRMGLAAPDRDIAGGHFEAWFVGKTLNTRGTVDHGTDAPATVVGSVNASIWNCFGFKDDTLNYVEYSGGYQSHVAGSGLDDDVPRLHGVAHSTGDIRFFVGDQQQGATITTSTFNTSWTGWDGIGAGYLEDDRSSIVLGPVVVLREASDATFRRKLAQWAKKWGA